jgi:hypothetical protein
MRRDDIQKAFNEKVLCYHFPEMLYRLLGFCLFKTGRRWARFPAWVEPATSNVGRRMVKGMAQCGMKSSG